MPTLMIKGVPPKLHETLKKRAERHRRSMNNELLTILERTLTPSRKSAEEAIVEADHPTCDCEYVALAQELGVTLVTSDQTVVDLFPDTAVLLKEYARA